jgi:hypothetical protein
MKEEVAAMTTNRSDWPRSREFEAAGKRPLYEAITRKKLRKRMARELGLSLPPDRRVVRGRWTEPAIRAALDELLRDRDHWPTQSEFHAAGLNSLRVQLHRDGSRDVWARRYGIKRRGPRTP